MSAKAKPVDALDPRKALVPSVVKVNEVRVAKGFWPKIQRTAARIPFADQALAAWYAARDPATPLPAKGMIFATLGANIKRRHRDQAEDAVQRLKGK